MGNGAMPHGPSDRAHPRLYRHVLPTNVANGAQLILTRPLHFRAGFSNSRLR